MRDAAADLLLGSRCVGCARPGRVLCPPCREDWPRVAAPAAPDPCPTGLGPLWAGAAYAGSVREAVLAHKEHAVWSLARPLGDLLAAAVLGALAGRDPRVVALLVPVPSAPAATRRRGHDPTGALTASAARSVRAAGRRCEVVDLLRLRGRVRDQGGLDAAARADNLRGALWVPGPRLARLAARHPAAWPVVCDDVVTTGATLVEARRALAGVGLAPVAAAVVAATARRRPGRDEGRSDAGRRA